MRDFFSVQVYVFTLILRAIWSLIICVVACTGIGIAATNNLKHNQFEFCYFLIVFLAEFSIAGVYLWLYRKQRGLTDLEQINKRDCVTSCFWIFFRLGFHIALSLFIVIRIHMENFMKKDYKWREIRDLTLIIMSLTAVQIIGFIVGLIYQPLDYQRRQVFSDIRHQRQQQAVGGVPHNELVIDEEDEYEEEDHPDPNHEEGEYEDYQKHVVQHPIQHRVEHDEEEEEDAASQQTEEYGVNTSNKNNGDSRSSSNLSKVNAM